jgi:hypothetical protein
VDSAQRRVPFLAPVFASLTARVARQMMRAAMPRATLEEVRCGREHCGQVVALWWPLSGLLYAPARDGIGPPLSADRRADVAVRCDRCGRVRRTSGRAVGRNLHNGRPPLA